MDDRLGIEAKDACCRRDIVLCPDGYVRLSEESLRATPIVHLISGLDEDHPGLCQEGACLSSISGYTEWVSTTTPAITIGWDWQILVTRGRPSFARLGSPRTNVMLVDDAQRDLGPDRTLSLLENAIDAWPWQRELSRQVSMRYS